MCAVSQPSQITVDTPSFTFYRDTVNTIAGNTDTESITLNTIEMTTISEAAAIQCPSFTHGIHTHDYPNPADLTCSGTNCDVKITSSTPVGTYTVTYRVEVASESWHYDWTFDVIIE